MDSLRTIDCGGTNLLFREVGEGNAVVFVPGLGSGHGMFEPQVEAFRATHRLILPDLRGNGGSGRLTGPVRSILDRQCDDLAALLDRLGVDRVVMVGVSYGGVVAIHFALRHPERLAGLVVSDTFADIDKRNIVELLFWIISYAGLWVCYLPKPLMKVLGRIFYRRWPVARDAITGLIDAFRPTEAVLQSLAMNAVDYPPSLGALTRPTLGIVGGATKTGIRFMERAMKPIPGARLEIIPDSFDPSNLCRPDEFNRLLEAFLRSDVRW